MTRFAVYLDATSWLLAIHRVRTKHLLGSLLTRLTRKCSSRALIHPMIHCWRRTSFCSWIANAKPNEKRSLWLPKAWTSKYLNFTNSLQCSQSRDKWKFSLDNSSHEPPDLSKSSWPHILGHCTCICAGLLRWGLQPNCWSCWVAWAAGRCTILESLTLSLQGKVFIRYVPKGNWEA